LLPVAIGGVAALALIAGLLLVIVLGGSGDGGIGQTSPSPEPSTSPASAEASPSASLEPTPEPNAIIPNRAIAEVTQGSADIYAQPGDASAVKFNVDTGRRVFVIGEPQAVGDERWYRVGIVYEDGCGEGDTCEGIGWVATPVSGESSVQEVEIKCPDSPMTDEELGALEPLERLHCYGRDEIAVTGIVDTPCCGYVGPYLFRPVWLAHPDAPAFLHAGGFGGFGFRHDPAIELEVPERGDVVRVTGHFEDPAAVTCRQRINPDFTDDPVEPVDQAMAVLTCRSTFVWSDYEVTDHEDLGPCCGSVRRDPVEVLDRARRPVLHARIEALRFAE
jgi:hypothetical protein